MSDDIPGLDEFDGIARLFPLPNLVLFPAVIQPLHIFEPRYRAMTADALEGDRLIAIVLLEPGWEGEYEGTPPICSVACLGRIIADKKLEDGRYNLLLRGLCRVRVFEELSEDGPYRMARVEVLSETDLTDPVEIEAIRVRLKRILSQWIDGDALDQLHQLLRSELPVGILCDIVAFALRLEPTFKQLLLEELDVGHRAGMLLDHLEAQSTETETPRGERKFPPEFSEN